MDSIGPVISWILENWKDVLVGANAVLGGLIMIFLLVPGEQPEKTFKMISEWLEKISKK